MIGLIVLATLSYAIAIIAFGQGPKYFDSNLFGSIVNVLGALVPLTLFAIAFQAKSSATLSNKGLIYAVLGGLAIAVFTIALTKVFASGQNTSFVVPLVYGGAVLISSVTGLLAYGEKITMWGVGGLVLIATGILLVAYSSFIKGVA